MFQLYVLVHGHSINNHIIHTTKHLLSPYVAITTNLFLHYVAVFPNQSHLLCEVKPKDVSTVPHQARSLVDILYTDYWTHVKYF